MKRININYQLNYFLNYLLLLEMIIINLSKTLNNNDIKNNYLLKNSSFAYTLIKTIGIYLIFSKKYFDYVESLISLDHKYKIYIINLPESYLENANIIWENILKDTNNLCYCKREINVDSSYKSFKFNLLFSEFEISLDLFLLINKLDTKICNLDQNLKCKLNKKIDLEGGNKKDNIKTEVTNLKPRIPESVLKMLKENAEKARGIRKYHTSTKVNNEIIEMKESDFKSKENIDKKYGDSLFNILKKVKYLTSTPYDPKEVQQLIEDH